MIDTTFLRIQLARLLYETSKDLETAEWCAENSSYKHTRRKWRNCKEIMVENSEKYGAIPMGDTQDTIQKRVFERGVNMAKIYNQIIENQQQDTARRVEAENRASVLEDALMSLLADGSAENKNRIKNLLADMNARPRKFMMRKPVVEQEFLEE